MTIPTGIDRDAPVIAHHQIDITAPLDAVWNGGPADADPTGMQTILGNSLTAWLTRLKQKAESPARGS